MSGGSLDYGYEKLLDLADKIEIGGENKHPITDLHRAFAAHLRRVADVAKKIEWAWSGDSSDEDAEQAIRAFLRTTTPRSEAP